MQTVGIIEAAAAIRYTGTNTRDPGGKMNKRRAILTVTLALLLVGLLSFFFLNDDDSSFTPSSEEQQKSTDQVASNGDGKPEGEGNRDKRAGREGNSDGEKSDKADNIKRPDSLNEDERLDAFKGAVTISGRIEFTIDGKPDPSLRWVYPHLEICNGEVDASYDLVSGRFRAECDWTTITESESTLRVTLSTAFAIDNLDLELNFPDAPVERWEVGKLSWAIDSTIPEDYFLLRGVISNWPLKGAPPADMGIELLASSAGKEVEPRPSGVLADQGVFWAFYEHYEEEPEVDLMQMFFALRPDFEDARKPIGRIGSAYDLGTFETNMGLIEVEIHAALPSGYHWDDQEPQTPASRAVVPEDTLEFDIDRSSLLEWDEQMYRATEPKYIGGGQWRSVGLARPGRYEFEIEPNCWSMFAFRPTENLVGSEVGDSLLRRFEIKRNESLLIRARFKAEAPSFIDIRDPEGNVVTDIESRYLLSKRDAEKLNWSVTATNVVDDSEGHPYPLRPAPVGSAFLQVWSKEWAPKFVRLKKEATTYSLVLDEPATGLIRPAGRQWSNSPKFRFEHPERTTRVTVVIDKDGHEIGGNIPLELRGFVLYTEYEEPFF